MAAQEVIKEYLVKLGFVINKTEQKNFEGGLVDTTKIVSVLSKTLVAAAAAVAAVATKFASSMDQLYYSSQKASSSAANLRAFEYAGRQIGMTSEAIDGMITSLTMTLRTDPGMKGWIESLGVSADESRQGADIWLDLLEKLRQKPFYEGAQFAEMVGMSPEQLFQIETNLDLFRSKVGERKGMAARVNLDQDAAALAGRNLANEAGKIAEAGSIGIDKAGQSAAPTLQSAADHLLTAADALLRVAQGKELTPEQKEMNNTDHPWWARHRDESKGSPKSLLGSEPAWMDRLNEKWFGKDKTPAGQPQAASLFGTIEAALGLPKGELDHLWKNESNRGDPRYMKSPAGAEGHFGLMPGTSKDMGVKDPYDLEQSAWGAGKYIAKMHDMFGDWKEAEQAYNWGPGNMKAYLGAKAQGKNPTMPSETQKYTSGSPIIINVNGAQSPAATASAVARKLDQKANVAAADLQRYGEGAVR